MRRCWLLAKLGAVVESVNLMPILYKRLHIEGSTLRSRTLEYQTNLIARWALAYSSTTVVRFIFALRLSRFRQEVHPKITGEKGNGPIRTYIHKAGISTIKIFFCVLMFSHQSIEQVYPWTEIQAAHREMEENKNRYASSASPARIDLTEEQWKNHCWSCLDSTLDSYLLGNNSQWFTS